ncbi:alpha-ketoglutarate-dependent dioxygenase AlkB [Aliidiomarina sedimenti]|uniref:Alpha-ketoglutarate-dependent dioxygenase AlkB n=1 Tax=Aliidiomarina sedimenti TaxID=1933879 RepID=A0ABY0C365_9GAMM|nr:alpha-ketoglutarate-dependent dioxygenase AlkB [Aliidiomarina sedimenti]RUO32261.1 alpha-ketoglutarate-dependent dioxygenase AlkB [Aliidiomarina sedimenti]
MSHFAVASRRLYTTIELQPYRVDIPDGDLFYIPGWLTRDESNRYYSKLSQTLEWQQDRIQVFGKWHLIPRLQAWYGDSEANYQYSGRALAPNPWTHELAVLRTRLSESGVTSNSVLANWYRNGEDRMGWHSDNEPELGPAPTIASVSLGATRCFQLRHKSSRQRIDIELENGSLLIMGGQLQRHWQHGLPTRKRCLEGRINLTFRQVNSRAISANGLK